MLHANLTLLQFTKKYMISLCSPACWRLQSFSVLHHSCSNTDGLRAHFPYILKKPDRGVTQNCLLYMWRLKASQHWAHSFCNQRLSGKVQANEREQQLQWKPVGEHFTGTASRSFLMPQHNIDTVINNNESVNSSLKSEFLIAAQTPPIKNL